MSHLTAYITTLNQHSTNTQPTLNQHSTNTQPTLNQQNDSSVINSLTLMATFKYGVSKREPYPITVEKWYLLFPWGLSICIAHM